jgi:hypothetical protein
MRIRKKRKSLARVMFEKWNPRRKYTPEEELKISMMDQIILDARMDEKEDGSNKRECAYRAWLGCRDVMGYSNKGLI